MEEWRYQARYSSGNIFWSKYCKRSAQGTDKPVLSPLETDMTLPMLAGHWLAPWLERQSGESAQKNPYGKNPTVVSPGHGAACRHGSSVWKARLFFFFCQRQCQIRALLWEMLRRLLQGVGSLTTHCAPCIFFRRKENLDCVSGLPASLEHAIFCPGRLETQCLGQKVWVPLWVANDP